MSKKNFLKIRILVIAVMVLVACTPTANEEPVVTQALVITEKPTEVPVMTKEPELEIDLACTISLWHSLNEDEFASLDGVLTAFQEIYPDAQFDVLFVPLDDMKGKFETSAGNGGGPSVLIGSSYWGPEFYDSLLIDDVSEFTSNEFLDTISQAALDTVEYKDGLLGLPLNIMGVLMFRNSSIIPEAPATLDDLITAAQAATNGDVVGSYLDYGLFFSAGHLHGLGGQLMDAKGDPTFNNEKGLKWIEMIKKFEESGPIENNTDNDVSLFQEGRAGIIIDGLWNAVSLAEAIGAENLVIDPWPADMSGYVQTDIIYLNANLSSDDAVCGWSLMEFMLSPEAHVIFSDPSMAGYIPTIVGVEVTDPIQQQVLVAFAGGTAFPVILEMGAYWDPVNNALLSAIEQGTDPAEALKAAHDAVVAKVAEIRGE